MYIYYLLRFVEADLQTFTNVNICFRTEIKSKIMIICTKECSVVNKVFGRGGGRKVLVGKTWKVTAH